MEFKNKFSLKVTVKRILVGVISFSMVTSVLSLESKADTVKTTSLITEYRPTITETVDSSGFKHPGVGLTKDILENMREEILAQKDPWYSYYNAMILSSSASKTVKSSNESKVDSTKPDNDAYNSQGMESRFIADGLKSYTQALMYYITGDEVYRKNALHIIRIWSQMDKTKYKYYADACIHSGIPLNRMVTAAEILRYTSCKTEALKWTDKDTTDFTSNLITPTIETFEHNNNHFMNQHLYPLIGAMSGYIFSGNRERYNEGVEWFTVNKTAVDQGQNGAIKQLFRLVDINAITGEKLGTPTVQHVEMGRDQAHGSGDLTNVAILSRLLLAQDTKVDPVSGTVSTADNAVTSYQFLGNRILKAADFFWKYMLGYNTAWTPVAAHTNASGTPTVIYKIFSDSYKGRMTTANFWDAYYYYKYTLGLNMKKAAPYFNEAFSKRLPSNYYYQGKAASAWDSVDGGGDFWLYIPKTAEAEGTAYVPKEQTDPALVQIEERYTAFDKNSSTKKDGDASYVRINSTQKGSKIAVLNLSYPDRTKPCIVGLKFKTNGTARLEMSKEVDSKPYNTLMLPNTKGQWKYITYDMGINKVSFSQIDKDYSLAYFKVVGDGTKVDLDCLDMQAGTNLSAPAFKAGNSDLSLFGYVGSSVPITFNFSAVNANAYDMVNYSIDNKPKKARINKNTGEFLWTPTKTGTYSFIVSASDGASVSTRKVTVKVTKNRKSAVAAVISPYNEKTNYEASTLAAYKKVYDDVINSINDSTDGVFYEKLSNLEGAVEKLKLLTPLLEDGSIDYPNIATSTAGIYTSCLVDNNPNSYTLYGTAPKFYHIFDFGPNFTVSASAFDLQVRMGFPERMAGTAVFGSNDGENWTQLTDETKFTEDEQKLDVRQAYKNTQFRYIKIQMIDPQPSLDPNITNELFEVSEFKIFGERYEVLNKK